MSADAISDDRAAWAVVLDRLEADANAMADTTGNPAGNATETPEGDAAERVESGTGTSAGEPWSPPRGLGPIPAELVARARSVHRTQLAAAEYLEGRRDEAARHLAAVSAVPRGDGADRSRYLDVIG